MCSLLLDSISKIIPAINVNSHKDKLNQSSITLPLTYCYVFLQIHYIPDENPFFFDYFLIIFDISLAKRIIEDSIIKITKIISHSQILVLVATKIVISGATIEIKKKNGAKK